MFVTLLGRAVKPRTQMSCPQQCFWEQEGGGGILKRNSTIFTHKGQFSRHGHGENDSPCENRCMIVFCGSGGDLSSLR